MGAYRPRGDVESDGDNAICGLFVGGGGGYSGDRYVQGVERGMTWGPVGAVKMVIP